MAVDELQLRGMQQIACVDGVLRLMPLSLFVTDTTRARSSSVEIRSSCANKKTLTWKLTETERYLLWRILCDHFLLYVRSFYWLPRGGLEIPERLPSHSVIYLGPFIIHLAIHIHIFANCSRSGEEGHCSTRSHHTGWMTLNERSAVARCVLERRPSFGIMSDSSSPPYAKQLAAAKAAARRAGEVIRNSRDRAEAKVKSGVDLVTAVDHEVEALVTSLIKKEFPSDIIIGEEDQSEKASGSQGERIPDGKVWCIDPIDGTTNFVHNYPFHCVSIGYCEGGVPRVGVIYIPSSDSMYEATEGGGAYLNGSRISVDSATGLGDCLLVNNIGHHRENDFVDESAERIRKWLRAGLRAYRSSGSACCNMAHVASGIVSVYYEHGYGGIWDICAGVVLVKEAGGIARACDGSDFELHYGRGSICVGNAAVCEDVIKVAGVPKIQF